MSGPAGTKILGIADHRWDGLEPALVGGRFHLTATCGAEGCTETRKWETRSVFDPNAAVAKARRAGWRTGKVRCPAHARPKREKPEVKTIPAAQPASAVPPAVIAASIVKPAPEHSEQALDARKLAWMMLDEQYDAIRKSYKPGGSDSKIAAECKLAEAAVAKIREEFFGPAGEPPEFQALRKKLDDARAFAEKITAEGLQAVERLRTEVGALQGVFAERIASIEADFERVALANGFRR